VTSANCEIAKDGPSSILACVDGSPTSLRAGAYAAGLARRQNSALVVVFVAVVPLVSTMAPGAAASIIETMEQMTADARRTVEVGAAYLGIAADFRALRGNPYDEICRTAEDERVDLVVVGASAQAGHRLVGSIAVRLVRAGKWPVVVVP
jgi:nucleotide-binding universal stress UspA family protein